MPEEEFAMSANDVANSTLATVWNFPHNTITHKQAESTTQCNIPMLLA